MEVLETEKTYKLEHVKPRNEPPKDSKFVAALLTPALFIFGVAILFPIIIGVYISFTNSSGANGYFGTELTIVNFYELLFYGNVTTRAFWRYTYQTLFFSIISLSLEFLLGLGFALILNKKFKGRGLARATLLIPWAIPTVASAAIFRFEIFNTLGEHGLINSLINIFGGLPVNFFGTIAPTLFNLPILVPYAPYVTEIPVTTTMFTVIVIDVWKTTPFITLLILAALQNVSPDLYKAGDIAGASSWQKFRYITWPLIKPGVGVALIFRMMQALRVYDAIVIFNDATVRSMTSQAVLLWLNSEYGMASAVSVMLLAFIGIFALVINRVTSRQERRGQTNVIEMEENIDDEERNINKEEKEEEDEIENENESIEGYNLKKEQSIGNADITTFDVKIEGITESKVKWYKAKRSITHIGFIISVILMILFCAAPFIWVVMRSFRNPFITQADFELFPPLEYLSLRAYEVVLESEGITGVSFADALLNGLLLSGTSVLVVIIAGSLIGYVIAKFKFPLKKPLNGFIFSMNSLPPLIIILPFYIQIIAVSNIIPLLDLRDNIFGLVLPYAAFNLPLAIFVLIAFFREIPEDLWKAAKVDGASNFQIFRKVILPLTIPGIFTCAILVFIAAWNELLFAQVFLISPSNYTVPRYILGFSRNLQSLTADWDPDIAMMAATTIATLPLVIIVLIFQKKIISGLTRGAVKG